MRRSLLFIPANNPGMLQNANVFKADSVIFDLEDAVGVTQKDSARILLKNFLATFCLDLEVIIRINDLDTPYYMDDLNTVLSDNVDTIMLPKANVKQLRRLAEILSTLEKAKNLKKKIKIIPIIELATSVLEVDEIVKCERVDGVLLGAEDLSSDMEFERTLTGDEIFYPRAKIAYACKAHLIDAIDTPFTDVHNLDGLLKDSLRAKNLGMNAKSAIHPNQVSLINKTFSPTQKQIETALKIELAAKSNKGVFSLDGKMVDKPIIERSKKVLEKARKYDLL